MLFDIVFEIACTLATSVELEFDLYAWKSDNDRMSLIGWLYFVKKKRLESERFPCCGFLIPNDTLICLCQLLLSRIHNGEIPYGA